MLFAALIGVGIQAIVSLAVGIRLAALALRTRQLPELTLAMGTLLLPALGYPSLLVAALLERLSLPGVGPVYFFTLSAMMLAISMNYVFTWRVFRPDATWAAILCGAGAWLLFAPIGGVVTHISIAGIDAGMQNAWAWTFPIVAAVLAGYAWTGAESFRYYLSARRRMRLGLADPAVCNRFLLWALASWTWLLAAVVAGVLLVFGLNPMSHGPFTFYVGLAGLSNSLCMTLCFMPPARYLDWLRRRQTAPAVA
jgi:hypothetical protein